MIDYSLGRYIVFNAHGELIGRIDEDEFIRDGAKLVYRLDGAEVYAVNGRDGLLGFIENGIAKSLTGQELFRVEAE